VLRDDIGAEPIRHLHPGDRSHHAVNLSGRQVLGLNHEGGQKLGIDVPGLPKGEGQLMIGLDLLRQLPDVAPHYSKLILAGTGLGILRPHPFAAKRFELL
jgi:hypothetical protein